MPGAELPRNLAATVAGGGPALQAWATSLPRIVDELARRWSLEVGRPFQPGGTASWVAPARNAAGDHVVLKVGWPHSEARDEAAGLRVWDGAGTVRLVDATTVGATAALLLEACQPGNALSGHGSPPEQDAIVAGLLHRLWIDPPAGHLFRTLASMCHWWADEFEAKYAAAEPARRVDPGLAREGIAAFHSLPDSAPCSVLLSTDLHPDNVLAATREPWLVIDPKPYVGDPTYDPLQHMLNFPDRLVADPLGFIGRMAGLLDLNRERLREWAFARCVQESIDLPRLHGVVRELAT